MRVITCRIDSEEGVLEVRSPHLPTKLFARGSCISWETIVS